VWGWHLLHLGVGGQQRVASQVVGLEVWGWHLLHLGVGGQQRVASQVVVRRVKRTRVAPPRPLILHHALDSQL
jgi:hypothetical protein